MKFDIKKMVAPDIDAIINEKPYTFRVFKLKDWGKLSRKYEDISGIRNATIPELEKYAWSPKGMQDIINISCNEEKAPDISEYKSFEIFPLIMNILDIGGQTDPLS